MNEVATTFVPSNDDLLGVFNRKYRRNGELDWGPRLRLENGYFSPDDHYEALVEGLVREGIDWVDIGCGRDIFPSNRELAERLAGKTNILFGIDPDPNILENTMLNQRFHGPVEDCPTELTFDVATLRMVAEHIVDPHRAVARMARLLKPGGYLVIYTPYKWSPMSLIATALPFALHHPLKKLIWDAQAKDTFPTTYRMNTRRDLLAVTSSVGLQEVHFELLDDCRVLGRYRFLNWCELKLRRALKWINAGYPEKCILCVYQK
jgi:SAM-dependent methyltransferase